MKHIYLVTSGCYSSYAVLAAFTSKTKAEAWRESQRYNPDDFSTLGGGIDDPIYGYAIEEFPLNPTEDNPWRPSGYWKVYMWEDGDSAATPEPVVVQEGDPEPYPMHIIEMEHRNEFLRENTHKNGPQLMMTAILRANDAEHAIKAANELRTLLRASETWVASPEKAE